MERDTLIYILSPFAGVAITAVVAGAVVFFAKYNERKKAFKSIDASGGSLKEAKELVKLGVDPRFLEDLIYEKGITPEKWEKMIGFGKINAKEQNKITYMGISSNEYILWLEKGFSVEDVHNYSIYMIGCLEEALKIKDKVKSPDLAMLKKYDIRAGSLIRMVQEGKSVDEIIDEQVQRAEVSRKEYISYSDMGALDWDEVKFLKDAGITTSISSTIVENLLDMYRYNNFSIMDLREWRNHGYSLAKTVEYAEQNISPDIAEQMSYPK